MAERRERNMRKESARMSKKGFLLFKGARGSSVPCILFTPAFMVISAARVAVLVDPRGYFMTTYTRKTSKLGEIVELRDSAEKFGLGEI